MNRVPGLWTHFVAPALAAVAENSYLAAIRAGMVAIVPLTIIGGFFLLVAFPPIPGWENWAADFLPLLRVPVTATFGLLSVFACFAVAYELGKQWEQEAMVSAMLATAVFLMLQVEPRDQTLIMENLGSNGLFTAIVVALVAVRLQKLLADHNLVIKLPASVPAVVYESFVSLSPLLLLVLAGWTIRFVWGVDVNRVIATALEPLVFALNTLPGILTYALLVTLLWSVGINGDNALDAVVAPIFLQYLAMNVEAAASGQPLPYVTAYGFFTVFVNVGGTGATLGLALVLLRSRDPGLRKVSRLSLPTQIFQINEPIFFGVPIVLNPTLMIPYILNALLLTASSYLLMDWNVIRRPMVNIPWTTPPILGHYLATGGDWRAAVWGALSIPLAMTIYYPFAKLAERRAAADT